MEKHSEPIFVQDELIAEHYRVLRLLGVGGYGSVYAVRDLNLGRDVAVKVLRIPAGQSREKDRAARFHREAKALSRLKHKNIVRVHRVGFLDDGCPYMVMDLIEGESLKERMQRLGPLNCQEAAGLCSQIADALAHAHSLSILHRDIKPENVLLQQESDGSLKTMLVDFGLTVVSTTSVASTRLTLTGAVLGTPFYMSPEQCEGQPVDGRADIYALGCLLFAMLTGQPPFPADNVVAALWQQVHEKPPDLCPRQGGAYPPPLLQDIIRKCLAKRPEDRYASCDLLVEDLQQLSQLKCMDTFSSAGPAELSTVHDRRKSRRWKVLWGTGAFVLIAAVALLLVVASPTASGRFVGYAVGHAPVQYQARILDALDAWHLPVADISASFIESTLDDITSKNSASDADIVRLRVASDFLLAHKNTAQLPKLRQLLYRHHAQLKYNVGQMSLPVLHQIKELQAQAQETAPVKDADWAEDTMKCYGEAMQLHYGDKDDQRFDALAARVMQIGLDWHRSDYALVCSNKRCQRLMDLNRKQEAVDELLRGNKLKPSPSSQWISASEEHSRLREALSAK